MLHGLGVIAWVGDGLALLVLHVVAVRSDDYDGLATAVRQSRVLGACLYGRASLVTAATGIALVATEDAFDFTDLWILIGIGGILLSTPPARGSNRLRALRPRTERHHRTPTGSVLVLPGDPGAAGKRLVGDG
jgi:hypothetical protein